MVQIIIDNVINRRTIYRKKTLLQNNTKIKNEDDHVNHIWQYTSIDCLIRLKCYITITGIFN